MHRNGSDPASQGRNSPASAPDAPPAYDSEDRAALHALAAIAPGLRLASALAIAGAIIAALYFGRDLLIPLALAVLLGFLLDPLVRRLKRWGLPRMAAIFVTVALALGALTGLGFYLGGQLASLAESLPRYQHTMIVKLQTLRSSIESPGALEGLTATFGRLREEISGSLEERDDATPSASDEAGAEVQTVQLAPQQLSPAQQAGIWLLHISEPLFTAGIVLLFVILVLLDRDGLRERLLRLVGGNIHLATDALDEAAQRIGKYLRMQLIVNIAYGFPLAIGLWLIGVPGAPLWGVVAALMRYIPYVGPALAAIFPLALSFAVGHGWDMLLWTLALIVALELISNNIIEPWLYGESTGLSTLAIIVSATFWTALWGPIGLILATPLTVCLLVLGRSIEALNFLEVLLGSDPVLTPPQRLYQRLLVEDVDSAMDLARSTIKQHMTDSPGESSPPSAVTHLYDAVALPALRLSSQAHSSLATAEQRFRFNNGMDEWLAELADAYPPEPATLPAAGECARVHCLGARWEVDGMAAAVMAHSLRLFGHRASYSEHALGARMHLHTLPDLSSTAVLCLAVFSPSPQAQIRYLARHIRQHWPHVRIVAGIWNAPSLALTPELAGRVLADHLVGRLHEMVMRVDHLLHAEGALDYHPAPPPANEARRLQALHDSGLLHAPQAQELYQDCVRRAINAFDMKHAQIALIDAQWIHTPATSLITPQESAPLAGLPRAQSISAHIASQAAPLVIEDTQADLRFANNPHVLAHGMRFYAGVPLLDRHGHTLGALSIMDDQPHAEADIDMALLQYMASELMAALHKLLRPRKPSLKEAVLKATRSNAESDGESDGADEDKSQSNGNGNGNGNDQNGGQPLSSDTPPKDH